MLFTASVSLSSSVKTLQDKTALSKAAIRKRQRSESRKRAARHARQAETIQAAQSRPNNHQSRDPERSKRSMSAAAPKSTRRVWSCQQEDYCCPVCLELCAQPVLLPCKHFLCYQCNLKIIEAGRYCPICRAQFPENFVQKIDWSLQNELIAAAGEEKFYERVTALVDEGQWYQEEYKVQYKFGNTH